jgi:hypothetical protein
MKNKWIHYHATRLNLIDSLKSHLESCEKTNVYDCETNQSDSHSLMNEAMGVDLINQLIKKLYRDTDEQRTYKDAV